jgi:hypothetical protein
MTRYAGVLCAVVAVLIGTGCGKAEEKPVAAATGVDMSTLAVFLRYPGAIAAEKVPVTTAEAKGAVWTLMTGDAKDAIATWYRSSLKQQGWVASPETEAGSSAMLEWEKPDKTETVKIMTYEKDGKTHISLAHAVK